MIMTRPMAYDLVIDGILGIGGRPGLPDPVARLVQSVEAQGIPTIAVDLPPESPPTPAPFRERRYERRGRSPSAS